ncbi:hypothetical protein RESH_01587 [Rhodopirellula europaea SH398]|uniref:Uncharacterized protein n=1 Tax=Rhodopirellula europaea SH398 TaxID=1263868 RepID=M5S8E0_9BACT|nr:hypothetical protein RESH_01587 [Rhodopirellula europaea SH398]
MLRLIALRPTESLSRLQGCWSVVGERLWMVAAGWGASQGVDLIGDVTELPFG